MTKRYVGTVVIILAVVLLASQVVAELWLPRPYVPAVLLGVGLLMLGIGLAAPRNRADHRHRWVPVGPQDWARRAYPVMIERCERCGQEREVLA